MKKCSLLLLSFFLFVLLAIPVHAASFSLSASTKQVSPGSSFTIRVGGDAIGRVNLSINNGTLSTSSVWVEQNYVTVTVTAGGSGTVVITATPVVGFSDADANQYNPGARSVSVTISNSSTNKPSTTNPKPNPGNTTPKKSDNNDLASLNIKEGNLSPEFQSSKLEYNLVLPNEIKEINIEGTPSDTKAKVEGTGTKKVQPGNNKIEILVTAENGNKKTYTIHVYVEELPEVFLNYQGKQIGIVKNIQGLTIPEGFTKEQISINDKEISVFTKGNLTLVYGEKEKNEKKWYLYSKENQELISECIPIQIKNQMYYLIESTEKKMETTREIITINNTEIPCETFQKENNYCLIHAMNEEGTKLEYLYEKKEGTLQLFPAFLEHCEQKKTKEPILWGLIGLLLVFGSIVSFFYWKEKRGRKHENVQ